jgi:hypothetical protein
MLYFNEKNKSVMMYRSSILGLRVATRQCQAIYIYIVYIY